MKHLILCLIIIAPFLSQAEEDVTLNQISLFKGMVKIKVPSTFKSMSNPKIEAYYNKEALPKLVYANEAEDIRVGFDTKSIPIEDAAIVKVTNTVERALKKLHPKAKWKDQGVEKVNGHNVGFIEYQNKKPEKFYEFIFFTGYKGQMMSCTFHSPKKGFKPWKPIVREMMNSLKLE